MSEEYQGPATIRGVADTAEVELRLGGRFEPVDGRYHWGGRVGPDERVVGWVRTGQRAVTVQIGDRAAVAARLGELDPWGGVRVTGTGPPPWSMEYTVDSVEAG